MRAVSIATGLILLFISSAPNALSFDFIAIGGAGNGPDSEIMTCCGGVSKGSSGYGAVEYDYQISRYGDANFQDAE